MTGLVPYEIEPGWFLESGKEPKLFCQGCGEEIEAGGYGFNTQHNLLDCMKVLRGKIKVLEEAFYES